MQSLGPGLDGGVHVVVLDLAKVPGIVAIHDLLEGFKVVVEGKAEVANPSVGFGSLGAAQQAQLLNFRPGIAVQSMQQVKINRLGLQALQLLVEQAVEIGAFLDQPDGRLGGDAHPFAVAILQGFAQGDFAHLIVIHVGGIEIVDPGLDGRADHLGDFCLVDVACFCRRGWVNAYSQNPGPRPANPICQICGIALFLFSF